jgi:hypothetical protein
MGIATPTISPSNLPRQLSDGNDQGTTLGLAGNTTQGQPDKVGFFGSAVAQPSGNAEAAIARGQSSGQVIAFQSVQSGTSVQPGTTSEFVMTLLGASAANPVLSGDLVVINKPTSQAGLGVGNVRASGVGTVGVTFDNFNALTTTIVPTAGQGWAGVAIRGFDTLSVPLTPAAVPANTVAEQIFAVTGLRIGELAIANKPTAQAGLDIVNVRVAGNNQIGIAFMNNTGSTITPTAGESYTIFSSGGISAHGNEIIFQIGTSPVSIPAGGTTEFLLPVTGLSLGDVVRGISKPTNQNGIGITGMRVSVPSTIGVAFINVLGTTVAQPTAGEVYEVALTRANPVAPLVVYTPTLNPASVPGNTSAEQTFTVQGLIASTVAWVNKPTVQTGLAIVGVRVSAANTLAINFANITATSITPTQGEVYTVGNFQEPFQTGGINTPFNGNSVMKWGISDLNQAVILANAVRNALGPTGTNLIAGA